MKNKQINELEIFRFLDNGNKEFAARLMYKLYYHEAISFYESIGGLVEDAKDVFPYMVLNFFEKYKDGRFVKSDNSSLRTYLFSVLKFQFYKKLRDSKEVIVPEFSCNIADDEADMEDILIIEETENQKKNVLNECMNLLNEKCKKIIIMYYYDKLNTSKIAETLGYGTDRVVITTKNRCMNHLKECCSG